jgi:membrane protein
MTSVAGKHAVSNFKRHRTAQRSPDTPQRGWWDIAVQVKRGLDTDNVSIIAAGLALYALLAVFPALAAAVSIYGLFASPAEIGQHLQELTAALPEQALGILQQQLADLSARQEETLSTGAVLGLLLALWSARKGMVALMAALNVAYGEEEKRGFFKQILVSSAFTIGAVLGFLAVLLLGVAVPFALQLLPLDGAAELVVLLLRWALLWMVAIAGLAAVYRYAPDRGRARWRWLTPGSLLASTLWLAVSLLFALYVRNWGSYGETYGALGGVVVLLMWFYLSGYMVILGAEINARAEDRTVEETIEGTLLPRGEHGAYAADSVDESAGSGRAD